LYGYNFNTISISVNLTFFWATKVSNRPVFDYCHPVTELFCLSNEGGFLKDGPAFAIQLTDKPKIITSPLIIQPVKQFTEDEQSDFTNNCLDISGG
jgi:hypothetical protein